MIKQAPSLGRILAMVVFSMSCIGLILFLWLSFGGPLPLKPEGYRVKVAFPEAIGVINDVDVRASGITIGTVRDVDVDQGKARTVATLVLDSKYAPLASDARATLRRKTLLGETFVEITTGTRGAPKIEDGGRLDDGRVQHEVELDEVFQTYDPITRQAIQQWQQELGAAVEDRGEELNNALGQLPEFTGSASDLLEVLYRHEGSVRRLVHDTGEVYGALTRDENQLRNLIRNSHNLFGQTASQRESLAEAIHIFPTFLTESKATLERLETFSRDARPLVRDLRPVARELRPTISAARRLAPDLRRYFGSFDTQIDVFEESGPQLRQVLRSTRPMLRSLGPFLREFNPILQWIEMHQLLVSDFLGNAASGTADTVPGGPPGEPGHYLRQLSVTGLESIGIHRQRVSSNRGNAYLPPVYTGRKTSRRMVQPNWDCIPATGQPGGEVMPSQGPPTRPGCWTFPNLEFQGRRQGRYSHILAADYSR